MQIDVIKSTAVAAGGDQIRRIVRGEAHVTDPPIGLPAPDNIHAARRPERLLQMFRQVDAMDGQEIDSWVEPLEVQLEIRLKISGVGAGRHLALKQDEVIQTSREGQQIAARNCRNDARFRHDEAPVNGSLSVASRLTCDSAVISPAGGQSNSAGSYPPRGEQRVSVLFCRIGAWGGQPSTLGPGLKILGRQLLLQLLERFKSDPVNATGHVSMASWMRSVLSPS